MLGQVSKQRVQLEARHVTTIQARVHIGARFSEQTLLFITCEPSPVPEGLVIQEGLVKIRAGGTVYVPVMIANTTKSCFELSPLLLLDHLQVIKTAYQATAEPLAVCETQLAYGSQQIPNIIQTCKVVATSSQAERSSQWDPQ